MAGELGAGVSLTNDDNFHRVESVTPIHLPYVATPCDGKSKCEESTVTISENIYGTLDKFDTGYYPIAATEMKVKLSSRQRVQQNGGKPDAVFHETDEEGFRCAEINQKAIDWAYSKLSSSAKSVYDAKGVKMVVGDDNGPYN
jgi:hypothetical protein